MTHRAGDDLPLPYPTPEYSHDNEEIFRDQVRHILHDIRQRIDQSYIYEISDASLATRRYHFMSMASGIVTYG